MTDLLYHHVKIKEGEPDYKKGELRYHYVKIEEEPKVGWEEPKDVKDYFIQRNKEIEEHIRKKIKNHKY